jgi:hypothetical protein
MARSLKQWPEPWIRLTWSDNDVKRIQRLIDRAVVLNPRDLRFVEEMSRSHDATLQQVSWLRKLAWRYKVPEPKVDMPDRHYDLE